MTGPLDRLLESGDVSQLEQMLSSTNINLEEADDEGWSALFHAVNKSNLSLVDCLLEKGSNPNKTDCGGRTPVLVAIAVNSLEILQSLIRFRADNLKR